MVCFSFEFLTFLSLHGFVSTLIRLRPTPIMTPLSNAWIKDCIRSRMRPTLSLSALSEWSLYSSLSCFNIRKRPIVNPNVATVPRVRSRVASAEIGFPLLRRLELFTDFNFEASVTRGAINVLSSILTFELLRSSNFNNSHGIISPFLL